MKPDEPGRLEWGKANEQAGITLTPAQQKSRNRRNLAIGLAVGVFILLVYFVTIAKLGPHVLDRPL